LTNRKYGRLPAVRRKRSRIKRDGGRHRYRGFRDEQRDAVLAVILEGEPVSKHQAHMSDVDACAIDYAAGPALSPRGQPGHSERRGHLLSLPVGGQLDESGP
jgi:hypothetical protein